MGDNDDVPEPIQGVGQDSAEVRGRLVPQGLQLRQPLARIFVEPAELGDQPPVVEQTVESQ